MSDSDETWDSEDEAILLDSFVNVEYEFVSPVDFLRTTSIEDLLDHLSRNYSVDFRQLKYYDRCCLINQFRRLKAIQGALTKEEVQALLRDSDKYVNEENLIPVLAEDRFLQVLGDLDIDDEEEQNSKSLLSTQQPLTQILNVKVTADPVPSSDYLIQQATRFEEFTFG